MIFKMQKQVNKDNWDGSDIVFKRKICIDSAKGPSLANVTKKTTLKICTYFIFGHWQGAGWNSKFGNEKMKKQRT